MQDRWIERRQQKSSEGEFLYELRHSYELSPKLSEEIVRSAKQHLMRDHQLKEGQIEVTVIGVEERSGKMIEKMEKRKVRITLDDGSEDLATLKEFGRRGLRQVRLERMTEEAVEQGGVLSQEDLSKHLQTSIRTIKRDIQELKGRGVEIITRGVLHNIGRGQTHKVKIIGMYLEGMTYSELRQRTRHSVGAIKRYLESFTKVLMAERHRIGNAREISQVTGLSEYLVRQYQGLLVESKKDQTKRAHLEELIERSMYREGTKKTFKVSGNGAVLTTGGS